MPEAYPDILNQLEKLAAYDGPWLRLRRELPRLRARVAELRERETHSAEVLLVALVGGSGVGKSTLLNALAGDMLAEVSHMRPCTSVPTVYHPPGAALPFAGWRQVSGSALEHLVLIDTPDSDTIVREHRKRVEEVLKKCDLILLCGSEEKYLDEATWSLLRPIQQERAFVCVQTKALLNAPPLREHWLQRLHEEKFKVLDYFPVNALKSLNRKLDGRPPGADELDFPRLEQYLREELSRDHILRIKRSNAAGLLMKTVANLDENLKRGEDKLPAALQVLEQAKRQLAGESLEIVERRLFAEPHLWNYAFGREFALRVKGVVGTLYRVIEGVRSLPARVAGWLPSLRPPSVGRHAASMLSSRELIQEDLQVASEEVAARYQGHQSEVALALTQAELQPPPFEAGLEQFRNSLNHRVTGVMSGPARDQLVRYARRLSSWPFTLLLDLPPLLFFV